MAAGLALWLWLPVLETLKILWTNDPSLSHGPLVPFVTAGLLYSRRKCFTTWSAATRRGLAMLAGCAFLFVAAVWADVDFLKPLSLVGMMAGGVWYLGGWQAIRAAAGPLGFLAFMIPWPTTIVERVAFPLQLASSAYAAILGGILGLPIYRDGVHLAVVPNLDKPPVYSILVARQCSGLTSLMVLLAVGYLIAYFSRIRLGWRALMVLAVLPLALFSNALRLTLILLAGAKFSPAFAQWVHDHEAPFLVFLCSMGLLAIQRGLTLWTQPSLKSESSEAPA